MATKRIKPNKSYTIKDLDGARAALLEIGRIRREVRAEESALNEEIDAAKNRVEVETASRRMRVAQLEADLQAWAEHNKDELFEKTRTLELLYGKIGFRRSQELKPAPKRTWKQVLGRLTELGLTDGIRVRRDVDRDALREWPPERLAEVDARIVRNDRFWYEIDEVEVEKEVS